MNVGLVYTYLAGHVGHFGEEGAFRAPGAWICTLGFWTGTGVASECQSILLSYQMYHITIDEGWHIQSLYAPWKRGRCGYYLFIKL